MAVMLTLVDQTRKQGTTLNALTTLMQAKPPHLRYYRHHQNLQIGGDQWQSSERAWTIVHATVGAKYARSEATHWFAPCVKNTATILPRDTVPPIRLARC